MLVPSTVSTCNDVISEISEGNVPISCKNPEVSKRRSSLSERRSPMLFGIVPVNELLNNSIFVRDVSSPIVDGILPVKEL
jgi:hypothetical protein